jgi:hypothetical protein
MFYSDTPKSKSLNSNLVCRNHRKHFIIARRLQVVHPIYNLAYVDDFSNLAGREESRRGVQLRTM